jgi:hypothetical protein
VRRLHGGGATQASQFELVDDPLARAELFHGDGQAETEVGQKPAVAGNTRGKGACVVVEVDADRVGRWKAAPLDLVEDSAQHGVRVARLTVVCLAVELDAGVGVRCADGRVDGGVLAEVALDLRAEVDIGAQRRGVQLVSDDDGIRPHAPHEARGVLGMHLVGEARPELDHRLERDAQVAQALHPPPVLKPVVAPAVFAEPHEVGRDPDADQAGAEQRAAGVRVKLAEDVLGLDETERPIGPPGTAGEDALEEQAPGKIGRGPAGGARGSVNPLARMGGAGSGGPHDGCRRERGAERGAERRPAPRQVSPLALTGHVVPDGPGPRRRAGATLVGYPRHRESGG